VKLLPPWPERNATSIPDAASTN